VKQRIKHSWHVSPKQAKKIQLKLRKSLRFVKGPRRIRRIAACDVSYKNGWVAGVVVVYSYPELELLEVACKKERSTFPYVPGLLTFREGPVLCKIFKVLTLEPDVILFDGQGKAHPLRLGEAAHLGLLFDKPSIGCAKSRFIGEYNEPGRKKGSVSKLYDGKEVIGAVLRSRDRVNPIFVSPGHKMDLNSSLHIVKKCLGEYRIPEPLRQAHILSVQHVKKR
jgi:deoxyribonuclease V